MLLFRPWLFAALVSVLPHSQGHPLQGLEARTRPTSKRATENADLQALYEGNEQFRTNIEASDPGLLQQLADQGQAPPYVFIGCSDSRVSEGTIFNAKPGTLFAERSISNQFHATDNNAVSILGYAIENLRVRHVIVMGHYGCGGVAAAIASPPKSLSAANIAVQTWIAPIRQLFYTSTRSEIVELRTNLTGKTHIEEPNLHEPGFRALVEENVKASVRSIANHSIIAEHHTSFSTNESDSAVPVFIHGWVYDIENGQITDLNVTVGPPGVETPPVPQCGHSTISSILIRPILAVIFSCCISIS